MRIPEETLAATDLRWRALDQLLPSPSRGPAGCGTDIVALAPDGRPAAVAVCEHSEGAPGSMELTWSAARAFRLTAVIADADAARSLDIVLSRWREHLDRVPGADGPDTSAVVIWPSRDVTGVAALLRHGLAPLAVVAVRDMRRPRQPQFRTARAGSQVRIRRAGPADVDQVTRLGLATIRFDAHFGAVTVRADTEQALRAEAATALAAPEPWVWLAERDGSPAGLAWAERPEAASWIAPMTSASPVAYLYLAGVATGDRGAGVGTALVGRAHHEIEAAGVAATLLHFALPNPLSAPFWALHGYRPLWTAWEARPAGTLL